MADKNRKKPLRWKLRGLMAVMLALATTGALAFALREEIVAKVLDIAEARLAEKGLYMHRASHKLSWRRGVILNDLTFYMDLERKQAVARFDNFGIRIPLHELFNDNATLIFTTNHSDINLDTSAGNLRLSQVDSRLTFAQESLSIDRFDSRLNGLHVTGTGTLTLRAGKPTEEFLMPDLAPLVRAASWLDFPQGSPTLALQIRSDDTMPGNINLRGTLNGTNFRWKQLSLGKTQAQFELKPDIIEIPAMSIDCYGGNLSGNLNIDYQKGELIATKIVSTVEPFRFVSAIMKTDSLDSCRSIGQTVMSGENITFDLQRFAASRGVFQVKSPDGLAIKVDSKEIKLMDFQSTLSFAKGNMILDASEFTLLGGKGSGAYTLPLSGAYQYQIKVAANEISLAQLSREFGMKENLVGTLNSSFDGGGASGTASHHGNGHVSVKDGAFYTIPLLGSLRAMLTEQSPGFGVDEARDLNASFSLNHGILHSPDFHISSITTTVKADARVDLIHKTLDADVRAGLRGIAGLATGIVSRIFEIHGQGPLDAVKWRFKHVPHLAEEAVHIADEGVEMIAGQAGKAIEGAGKTTGKVLEDVGDAGWHLLGKRPRLFTPKEKSPPFKE